ncbi:MAG: dihydrodipicolinate synthase family protein, partial [Gammaproteobacteria bacterium]
ANVAPKLMRGFCDAMLSGDVARGQKLDQQLQALHHAMFLESNPIPVKWALSHMGLIPPGIRLPLTPLSVQYHTALKEALNGL